MGVTGHVLPQLNAGIGGAIGPITETTVAEWDTSFSFLVRSVYLGCQMFGTADARQSWRHYSGDRQRCWTVGRRRAACLFGSKGGAVRCRQAMFVGRLSRLLTTPP